MKKEGRGSARSATSHGKNTSLWPACTKTSVLKLCGIELCSHIPKGKNLSASLTRSTLIAEQINFGDKFYMHIILQTTKSKGQMDANLKGLPACIQDNILVDISSEDCLFSLTFQTTRDSDSRPWPRRTTKFQKKSPARSMTLTSTARSWKNTSKPTPIFSFL